MELKKQKKTYFMLIIISLSYKSSGLFFFALLSHCSVSPTVACFCWQGKSQKDSRERQKSDGHQNFLLKIFPVLYALNLERIMTLLWCYNYEGLGGKSQIWRGNWHVFQTTFLFKVFFSQKAGFRLVHPWLSWMNF